MRTFQHALVQVCSIEAMTLKESNPHLRQAAARSAALRVAAQTSSAVEGIHAPFANQAATPPRTTQSFITHWQQRVAAKAR